MTEHVTKLVGKTCVFGGSELGNQAVFYHGKMGSGFGYQSMQLSPCTWIRSVCMATCPVSPQKGQPGLGGSLRAELGEVEGRNLNRALVQ